MGLESKDPRKGKKAKTWTVEKLKGGGEFCGWIAGRLHGVIVHTYPPSKPCWDELTDGKMDCPHCRKRPQVWNGYLPLYNESGQPTVVIINEDTRLQVQSLQLHQAVKVKRKAGTYAVITVEPSQWSKPYPAGATERTKHANLWPWLLGTLWKEPELLEFFRDDPLMQVPKVETVPSKDVLKAQAVARSEDWVRGVQREMLKQNGHEATAANLAGPLDDVTAAAMGAIRRRAANAEPSRNGSHRDGEG